MLDKKALLIMDMIKVYIYGEKPLIPVETRKSLIKNIKKAINLAHNNKIPVIYVNSAFKKSNPIYKLINYRDQGLENDPANTKIIAELKPNLSDYVLHKQGFDGFWKSGLDKLLEKLNIKEVFLTGCQTDCCIRETAVTASHLGYDVFVLSDCCQTSRDFGQIAAMRFFSICTKAVINSRDLKKHFTV